ncbi:hypothetical protein [Streptomyces pseudogriseolus]|uniref:hypothetical protein n=1 Tax=Streptomyces pseudogriseolus TaxID=36817 RepID=UPI003FA32353
MSTEQHDTDAYGQSWPTSATTGRGRVASSAMLLAHLYQPVSPAPEETTAEEPAPASAPQLCARRILAVAKGPTWAVAVPGERHWPDGEDFLNAALSAVRTEERAGYIERLEALAHRSSSPSPS